MDKARKMGWHGHVDTLEVVIKKFEHFVELKDDPNCAFYLRYTYYKHYITVFSLEYRLETLARCRLRALPSPPKLSGI